MSKREKKGDYEIGKGKPPKAHRWQPGQSGNKKGRPRGKKISQDDYLRDLRDLPVPIPGSDKPLPARAAMYRVAMGKALKGDLKAIQHLESEFRRLDEQRDGRAEELPLSPTDQELLRQYLEQNGYLNAGTTHKSVASATGGSDNPSVASVTNGSASATGKDGEGR